MGQNRLTLTLLRNEIEFFYRYYVRLTIPHRLGNDGAGGRSLDIFQPSFVKSFKLADVMVVRAYEVLD
jgi:hypothetical protein